MCVVGKCWLLATPCLGGLRLGASAGGVWLTLGNVRCDCGDMTCRLVLLVNGLRRYLPACPHSVSCCSQLALALRIESSALRSIVTDTADTETCCSSSLLFCSLCSAAAAAGTLLPCPDLTCCCSLAFTSSSSQPPTLNCPSLSLSFAQHGRLSGTLERHTFMEVLKSHFCFKSQEDVTALMKAVVYDQVHPTPRCWPLLDPLLTPRFGLSLS